MHRAGFSDMYRMCSVQVLRSPWMNSWPSVANSCNASTLLQFAERITFAVFDLIRCSGWVVKTRIARERKKERIAYIYIYMISFCTYSSIDCRFILKDQRLTFTYQPDELNWQPAAPIMHVFQPSSHEIKKTNCSFLCLCSQHVHPYKLICKKIW